VLRFARSWLSKKSITGLRPSGIDGVWWRFRRSGRVEIYVW
jgi:hypothetical protein